MDAENSKRACVIVAGPTASGKSALAVDIAERFQGVVINADSMQVYEGLSVVTACPSDDDRARAPHRLYGAVPPDIRYSAGQWVDAAKSEIAAAWADDRLPILCGGTGFYVEALTHGLSPVPSVPDAVRQAVRARREAKSAEAFHAELSDVDPQSAERLHPSDGQRVARALEVFEATGRALSEWFAEARPEPALDARFLKLCLMPGREDLYSAIDHRFAAMVSGGALDEVAALVALDLDPTLPAMKALGVPDLVSYLRGDHTLDTAVEQAQRKSRNYAKRQMTWLRNRLDADFSHFAKYSESEKENFFSIVREFVLTDPA